MSTPAQAQSLLRRLITEFTFHPKDLRVDAEPMGRAFKIIVQAHRADTPRIVGTGGQNIKALSALVKGMGARSGYEFLVELLEPRTGEKERLQSFETDGNWKEDYFTRLLMDVARELFSSAAVVASSSGESTVMELSFKSEGEQWATARLGEALKVVFNAIGKANGRRIHLLVLPTPAKQLEAKP